jgi:pimeloyl-ACP methyl ester carboxylesterase
MPKACVGDIEIYYRSRGSGPPLFLIMGFSANSDWWPPGLVDALAARHRVILLDNRGAGRTGEGKRPFTIPLMAADTVGLLNALGLAAAHVFGISMGGMIAQELALRYPHRVRKLVLGCTSCGTRGALFDLRRGGLWWDYLTQPRVRSRKLLTNLMFSPEYLNRNREALRRFGQRSRIAPMPIRIQLKQIAAMLGFDTYERLPRLQAPTLVMTGTRDYMAVPRNSEILARRIPGARLVKLEGCGHAFIAEAEEETACYISDFLGTD